MSIYGRNSDLGRLITTESLPYNAVWKAIEKFAVSNKRDLDFDDDEMADEYIELEDIYFKFAVDVVIIEDTVSFDAIIEGNFSARKKYKRDYDYATGSQWFRLACVMTVEDRLTSFTVKSVSIYTKEEKRKIEFAATSNFVPIIAKDQFDAEAERILKKWYPQTLTEPVPVPIEAIAERMGLKIIDTVKLTHDLSVFGQICFAEGYVKVYDEDEDTFTDFKVERGTIFIDPDTFFLRNLGCVNYTIAHEVFHWERHRVYATIKSILTKNLAVAHRCPTVPKKSEFKVTSDDEDWMEWQANAVAPKILMPKAMTQIKIRQLLDMHAYDPNDRERGEILQAVISEMSEFYGVSKQTAKIRMIELGWTEAAEVYNYTKDSQLITSEITPFDAFDEYMSNGEFRAVLDMGLFRNVEGSFVIDTDTYRMQDKHGEYVLTDYARENLAECSLNFAYNIVELFEINRANGIMYRGQRKARPGENIFFPEYNQENIDRALAAVPEFKRQMEVSQELCDETAAQTITRYMAQNKWNSSIFQKRTGLNTDLYRKITTTPNKKLKLPVVVSICVGLGLPQESARKLIEKAGHTLNPNNIEDLAYNMILSGLVPNDIIACNAFLEKIIAENDGCEIHLLGSQVYES